MNNHDERGLVPVDAQGNTTASSVLNSSSTTIKIDSLCIKLGFVKEKGDAEKCRHFSIRGYVSGMRERGSSNFLPLSEELPPMDVPHFKYWLCQSCLQNCGNANTSHNKTPVDSMCDQSMIRPCARSIPPQVCSRVAVLPFGEGTSGLKHVDHTNDDNDDDDEDDEDERVLPALGAHESQPSQAIPADKAVFQEPITFCGNDTNFASEANAGSLCMTESNGGRDDEHPQQDNAVNETVAGVVGPALQSNDHPNGNTRRKTRKVRLLKELLCGNNEIQQRKKENSTIGLDPKPSSSLPSSSMIKRKVPPHDQDQDQRSVEITTPLNACKKAKTLKGNAGSKATMVEHSKDSGVSEGAQNDKKYSWNKHGTHRSSIVGKVSSDPVTAWRSIFSDVAKSDNQAAATYDISKDRGSGPRSNLMAPPHPEKKISFSKKMPKNPLKSKFFGEDSRSANVVFGSRPQDRQSESDLGLDLSLNYEPQSQIRSMSSTMNRPPIQDYSRKGDFFMGESSIPHRIPSDSKSKEGSTHDVSNRHAARPVIFQEQRPPYTQFTYGSCSEHQKLDFSDPNKWNTGVRGYSDVMRPHNHQRQGKMVSMGRSDEREIVELMAKNQYERSLCEARGSNNSFMPHTSSVGFHNINMHERMASSHQDYFHMMRPASHPMSEKSNMRNPASGFFHQEQVSDFNVFDGFQQSRNQPSSGIWMSESGAQRFHSPHYHHAPKANKKMTNTHLYTHTNMQVLEALNKYNNGRHHQNETDIFSSYPTSMPHGYTKFSDKDNQKSIMDLDLNVVAPNVIEEQNNFESSSKEFHPKNIHSLDSSYPNDAIPAMQLLSLMDAGKSTHPVNANERKYSKPCYTHCSPNMTGKTKSTPNFQFPNSRFFQSSSLGVGSSFQSGQSVKLTSGQVYYKPQEEKSTVSHGCRPEDSYVFPVPWHVNESQNERVGPRMEPIGTEICTINKNPADFSTPGPENVYMINVEDLVFRGEKGRSGTENANGQKRQKRS